MVAIRTDDMLTLNQVKEYLNSSKIRAQLGVTSEEQIDCDMLGQGEYNANYIFGLPESGRKMVLRLNTGSQMHLDNQIEYEFNALKLLETSGRTPRAVCCDGSRRGIPYGALVMEWLPGRPLVYESDMEEAARIFADIHSVEVPCDSGLIEPSAPAMAIYEECLDMARHYLEWDRADEAALGLINELIEEIGKLPLSESSNAPKCIVNTEVNSGNFLINPGGKSYLIDWEKPVISEAAQDLAHFVVPTTTYWKTTTILNPSEIKAFVDAYIDAVGGRMDTSLVRERIELFFKVTCLRGITWCAMAFREYTEADRALSNSDTFAKIKEYLTPEFLEDILENYVRSSFL